MRNPHIVGDDPHSIRIAVYSSSFEAASHGRTQPGIGIRLHADAGILPVSLLVMDHSPLFLGDKGVHGCAELSDGRSDSTRPAPKQIGLV